MTYYNRIDISEGIDVNKTNESKECDICCYWYFLDKGFWFQTYVCSGCHDLLMVSISLDDIVNYRCIINKIRKIFYCKILKKVGHYILRHFVYHIQKLIKKI